MVAAAGAVAARSAKQGANWSVRQQGEKEIEVTVRAAIETAARTQTMPFVPSSVETKLICKPEALSGKDTE